MRVTKAMFEEENNNLKERIEELKKENSFLRAQIAYFKPLSPIGQTASIVIAAEKVTEALAHVISDLKDFRRR